MNAFSSECGDHDDRVDIATLLLRELGDDRGKIANFSRKVGVSRGQVTNILKGRRRPPLHHLDAWADALGLKDDARREFKMLAGLDHVKDLEVRELIVGEIAALRQKSERQEATIAAQKARLNALEPKKK